MPKPTKIETVKVAEENGISLYTDRKTALKILLQREVHSIFDREPIAGFNANFTKLVDKINNLYS